MPSSAWYSMRSVKIESKFGGKDCNVYLTRLKFTRIYIATFIFGIQYACRIIYLFQEKLFSFLQLTLNLRGLFIMQQW